MRFALILGVLLTVSSAEAQVQRFNPRLQQLLGALESRVPGTPPAVPQSSLAGVKHLTPRGDLAAGAREPVLTLMVIHQGLEPLMEAGFTLGTTTRRGAIVEAPLSRVRELETMPGIVSVNIPTSTYRYHLDESMDETGGNAAHGGTPPNYTGVTGENVVVGVVDTGIDVDHEDFKDAEGQTRILALWDQTSFSGPSPAGYAYGRDWSMAEINAGQCTQEDVVGHGTHVAGIAAGDGSEAGTALAYTYIGAAPEADIVGVKFTTGKGDQAIIDGVSYIFDKAGSKPAVANISLGSGLGPHDGQTELEIMLSDLTGPGRCIVAAGGNDGDVDCHATVYIPSGESYQVQFEMGAYVVNPGARNDVIRIDAWYPGGADMQFTLAAPNTSHDVGPANPGVETFSNTNSGYLYMFNNLDNPLNGDRECVMQAYDFNSGTTPPSGLWTVTIKNNSGSRQLVDLWVYSDMFDQDGFPADIGWTSDVNSFITVNSPATADDIIAVGAYVTKKSWSTDSGVFSYDSPELISHAAGFTSSGPRRDGVQKPELAAPGMGIISAMSLNASIPYFFVATSNAHYISQGTSQAAPHVAGTVALLLSKNDGLDPDDLKDILEGTVDTDAQTATFPQKFGAGKLRIDDAADSVTPVELLSFVAQRHEQGVTLQWETGESDAVEYLIERSLHRDHGFILVDRVENTGSLMAWTDPNPLEQTSWYRLAGLNRTGALEYLGTAPAAPLRPVLALAQNRPNPVSGSTRFAFSLNTPSEISLILVDLQGRQVMELAQGEYPAGESVVEWNGTLPGGAAPAAGVYFYQLRTPRDTLSKRLVILN